MNTNNPTPKAHLEPLRTSFFAMKSHGFDIINDDDDE